MVAGRGRRGGAVWSLADEMAVVCLLLGVRVWGDLSREGFWQAERAGPEMEEAGLPLC